MEQPLHGPVGSPAPFSLSGAWAIAPHFDLQAHMAGVPRQAPATARAAGEDGLPYILDPTGQPIALWDKERMQALAPGSVAVVPMTGVLVKQAPDWMAQYGVQSSTRLARDVRAAMENDKVKSIVLLVDSPGGMVAGTEQLGNAVIEAAIRKTVVAYVDGLNASAAYWASAASTRILLAGPTSEVGSTGAKIEVWDDSKMFEDFGIKRYTFYGDQAPEKDNAYRQLVEEGNKAPMKERASYLTGLFHSHLQAVRPGISAQAMRGDTYYGQQAIDAGLADGFATWQQAMALATNQKNPNPMSKTNIFATAFQAVATFFSDKEEAQALKPEQLAEANAKLAEQGVKAELVPTDELAALRARPESLPAITAEHAEVKPLLEQAAAAAKAELQPQLDAAAQATATLAGTLKELNVEAGADALATTVSTLKAWAKTAGEAHTATKKEGDDKGDGAPKAQAWGESISPAVAPV